METNKRGPWSDPGHDVEADISSVARQAEADGAGEIHEPIQPGTLPSGTVLYRCPWCPVTVPVPPWKTEIEGDIAAGSVTMKVTRAAWELAMLEHWREDHPARYTEFATDVLSEMGADIQAAARSLDDLLTEAGRRAGFARGATAEIRSEVSPPPWEDKRPFRVDLLPPTFEEFMRGWNGL